MQYSTRYRIHDPHDKRDQYCSNQYDHRRLLQLRPRRPGHFFQQLLIRLPEICRDFVHVFNFFNRLSPIPISTPPETFRLLSTGTRIRTQTEGFGDLCTTVILCPYDAEDNPLPGTTFGVKPRATPDGIALSLTKI